MAPPPRAGHPAPVRVGPYEILDELGRGGMGVVYRVRGPHGEAALKLLLKADPQTFARFEREQRLLASLGDAEGFVSLLDAGMAPGGAYLVMPLVAGGTLRQKLESGPLGVEETIAIGVVLATALGKAHARGIIHRDVKPENVLFDSSGRALLADLGLAKHFDRSVLGASQSRSQTVHGAVKGSPGYLAPEQLDDSKNVGPPCDVFALGAVLYECLAGRSSFQGDSVIELLAKRKSGILAPLDRPDVPSWLEKVLMRALALDPRNRFPDGASLARALLARGGGARPRTPWLPVALGVGGGALLLAAFLVGLGLGRSTKEPGATAKEPATPREPAPKEPAPAPKPAPEERLPARLRRAGKNVPAADGKEVSLLLYRLPDGSDMEMVALPARTPFIMGTDEGGDPNGREGPRHTRSLEHAAWIGRTHVTWGQYLAWCAATGHQEPTRPRWWNDLPGARSEHPVVMVSWDEAQEYCHWAGLDLPTEAEWECAARGSDGRMWPWGDEWDPGARCNFADASCPVDTIAQAGGKMLLDVFKAKGLEWDRTHSDGFAFTSPVGAFPRGASPVGALDMAGNAWQWCEDAFDARAYARHVAGDTSPASGPTRVNRGCAWDGCAFTCRSSLRSQDPPGARYDNLGFRALLRSP